MSGNLRIQVPVDGRPAAHELFDLNSEIEVAAANFARTRAAAHERYIRRHIKTAAEALEGQVLALPWWRPLRWRCRRSARLLRAFPDIAKVEAWRRAP